MVQMDKNNLAPRFGFACEVFGNGRSALRGGFRFFYDLIPGGLHQRPSTA